MASRKVMARPVRSERRRFTDTTSARITAMLEADFACSAPFDATAYGRLARFAAPVARLASPLL